MVAAVGRYSLPVLPSPRQQVIGDRCNNVSISLRDDGALVTTTAQYMLQTVAAFRSIVVLSHGSALSLP